MDSSGINAAAGIQHSQPTRQPDNEGGQPVNESDRDSGNVLLTCSNYRGGSLCLSMSLSTADRVTEYLWKSILQFQLGEPPNHDLCRFQVLLGSDTPSDCSGVRRIPSLAAAKWERSTI